MGAPYPTALERFPRLRQSVLSDADNCMLTSHLSLEHERGWSSSPAARGQIVHRTIARCLADLLGFGQAEGKAGYAEPDTQVPVDVALEALEDIARQAEVPLLSEDGMGDEVVGLPIRELAEARITVKTWAHYQAFSLRDFAGVERRLEATMHYPGVGGEAVERTITGKLDLLLLAGTHATVVDWKDTWGIPGERLRKRDGMIVGGRAERDPARPMGAEAEAEATDRPNVSEEGYFQQRFYALLVFRNYPRVQTVTLREFYLRYASGAVLDAKNRPINPTREATIDRTELPELEREMAALVERFDRSRQAYEDALAAGDPEKRARRFFKPTPGSHCSYCSDADGCPIYPKARQVGRIGDQEEAELYGARLQVSRAVSAQIAKALRAWANVHGPVKIKDAKRPRVYGPVVRSRTIKPSVEAVEAARRRGTPLAELYSSEEYVDFCVHTPEEQHPFAAEAAEEEAMLLAAEKKEAGGA